MKLIDLSRELYHRTPAHPSHPPVAVATWYDHDEVKTAGNTRWSSKALFLSMSDHAGTHVDAPCHFNPDPQAPSIDQLPLEDFFTEAICMDLAHVPLKHEITVAEMKEALAKSGQAIKKRDTVLINMGVNARLFGTPAYATDFPGLHVDSVHWLADHGILMFGVEAVSPAPQGEAISKPTSPVRNVALRISSACGTWRPWLGRVASNSLLFPCVFVAGPPAQSVLLRC